MAKLYFRYGAMNSGKSTALLQVAHNYEERDQVAVIVKPAVDTKASDRISSRVGLERKVDILLLPDSSLYDAVKELARKPDCVLLDEAQFMTRDQISDAFLLATQENITVIAYGLRTDFQTNSFEGSKRLMEMAHRIEEMKTICRCGDGAIFNARILDGAFVKEGGQVGIDGQDFSYESLCGKCYLAHLGMPQ